MNKEQGISCMGLNVILHFALKDGCFILLNPLILAKITFFDSFTKNSMPFLRLAISSPSLDIFPSGNKKTVFL